MPAGRSRGHPKLLQHTVKAIAKSLGGATRKNMSKAFAIATASLQRAGHLKPGSQKLTGKGREQSKKHHGGDKEGESSSEYEGMLRAARKRRQKAESIIQGYEAILVAETQYERAEGL